MNTFLERQQDLFRMNRFDEVIGNLRTDGLIHDILFLALRHHDDRSSRLNGFNLFQGFQSGQSGHVFVEQYQIEGVLPTCFDGIEAIAHRHDLVAFHFEKQDMAF